MTPNFQTFSSKLNFDNRFTRCLPGDSETKNYRRQVPGACYSRVMPTQVSAPRTIAISADAQRLLDLTDADCRTKEFTQVFSGNQTLQTMDRQLGRSIG